jgi:predicted O-methyltransferase YrrM
MAEPIRQVLSSIEDRSSTFDSLAKERVRQAQAKQHGPLSLAERDRLYANAPLTIAPAVGQLLYTLVRVKRPLLAFEFGASVGYSTLHIAAGLEDASNGRLVTTEKNPIKAEQARQNLHAAGLADRVEVRAEDALETIAALEHAVDLVFLDGWNDLYLDVLLALEPQLAVGAVVIADYSADDPTLTGFSEYIVAPGNGYATTLVPLSDGLAIAVRDHPGPSDQAP